MKPNTIQNLGTSALTILALVCLMAPSAMAQSGGILGGSLSGPGLGSGTTTVAHFDGDPINESLAQSWLTVH